MCCGIVRVVYSGSQNNAIVVLEHDNLGYRVCVVSICCLECFGARRCCRYKDDKVVTPAGLIQDRRWSSLFASLCSTENWTHQSQSNTWLSCLWLGSIWNAASSHVVVWTVQYVQSISVLDFRNKIPVSLKTRNLNSFDCICNLVFQKCIPLSYQFFYEFFFSTHLHSWQLTPDFLTSFNNTIIYIFIKKYHRILTMKSFSSIKEVV